MCLVDPNKFWPGFTLTQPGFSKSCWVRFPQLHGTNIYMGLFPGHESLTKYVSCGSKQILTWVYFYSAWFLEICWCSFRSASRHQYIYVYNTQHIYICVVLVCIYIYIYIYDSFPLAWSTTDFLITQPPLQTQKLDA